MSEEIELEVVPDIEDLVVEPPVDKSRIVLGIPLIKTTHILSFRLEVISLILGQSVKFGVFLESEDNGMICSDHKEVLIEGDEYLAWGADDMYIVELIKSKIASIV